MVETKLVNSEVEVTELPQSPDDSEWGVTEATVYHAMISHDPEGRPPFEIWKSDRKSMEDGELEKKKRGFLDKVLGESGHTSCGYQANVGLFFKVPRHTTMFLCSFDHSKYLQQSMRYTKAERFISEIDKKEAKELFEKQNRLYNKMIDDGIAREDARFVLPLASASNIHQNTNFVGLANIFRVISSEHSKVPESSRKIIEKGLEELKSEEPELFRRELIRKYNHIGKGYPIANLFSDSNRWVNKIRGELGSEKVTSFDIDIDSDLVGESRERNDQAFSFLNLSNEVDKVSGYLTKMSLSAWHQFMRQDTVKQSIESIYNAAERGDIITPHTVSESSYEENYLDLCHESIDFYRKLKLEIDEEKAIEVIPNALSVHVAFSLDGYNTISGFMHDRIQKDSQWEIRKIAKRLKDRIEEENKDYGSKID